MTKSIQQMAAQVGGFQGKTSAAGAQEVYSSSHPKVTNGIGNLTKQLQTLQAWERASDLGWRAYSEVAQAPKVRLLEDQVGQALHSVSPPRAPRLPTPPVR